MQNWVNWVLLILILNVGKRFRAFKNVIEDTEYEFFYKTTAYYVLFQDSAKWVSANRVSPNQDDTVVSVVTSVRPQKSAGKKLA